MPERGHVYKWKSELCLRLPTSFHGRQLHGQADARKRVSSRYERACVLGFARYRKQKYLLKKFTNEYLNRINLDSCEDYFLLLLKLPE